MRIVVVVIGAVLLTGLMAAYQIWPLFEQSRGGSGPVAHFSHATGLCAGTYTPLAERLRPHLRIFGMDDRGPGGTRAPASLRKLKNWDIFVDDLECFVENLGEPVVAMGHSRGAAVSCLLAIKRPDLVRALILIDPTILPFSWMWWWYLAQKSGLARYLPIVATAARRKDVWPDRDSILTSYRRKKVFSTWSPGFLESYITHGTETTTRRISKRSSSVHVGRDFAPSSRMASSPSTAASPNCRTSATSPTNTMRSPPRCSTRFPTRANL